MSPELDRAAALLQAGDAAAAARLLQTAVGPASAERDVLLAQCALQLGDAAAAAAAFAAALVRQPGNVDATCGLGALYFREGRLDEAEALYTEALRHGDDDRLRVDRAVLWWRRGEREAALAAIDAVLESNPRHAAARLQRCNMRAALERLSEAADDLRVLVRDLPGNAQLLAMLGGLEFRQEHYAAAIPWLADACRLNPADANSLHDLALAQAFAGRLDDCLATQRQLRGVDAARARDLSAATAFVSGAGVDEEFDPRPLFLWHAYERLVEGDWSQWRDFGTVMREVAADPRAARLALLVHSATTVPMAVALWRRFVDHAGRTLAARVTATAHARAPAPARLRIGYALPHMGAQVVSMLVQPLLAAHDPAQVDVRVFALSQTDLDRCSGWPERFAAIPGVTCVDLTELDDEQAAAALRAQGLDVLVDLAVYNDDARPGVLARRPAPVQVNFLGGPYTSGAPWLDYIVSDAEVSPGQPGWCSEAEVTLPSCYFVYGPAATRPPPPPPPRARFGLPEDRFIYSAFNSSYKLEPEMMDVWMRILQAVPDAVLLLRDGAQLRPRLQAAAAERGVDPGRLLFAPRLASDSDYLLRQGTPDLFLDTRVYGAHTTMADSLWMGVPGLTCRGVNFPGRVGASLLASCGLPELVVEDLAAYEAMAIALGRDRPRLQALKDRLARNRLSAAPFDIPGQARALEKAYRHMRERFAQGLPPAPFAVAGIPVAGTPVAGSPRVDLP